MPDLFREVEVVVNEVALEVTRAKVLHPVAFHSAHEGLAVIEEEMAELRQHVYMKQRNRDLGEMRKEAIEVAAMAVRFAMEVCDEEAGRR